jgi:hypothetical protein
VARWIASLALAMTVKKTARAALGGRPRAL